MSHEKRFHYIIAPALEMRKDPDFKSEVVSQGLFSEEVLVLEEIGSWTKVNTLVDRYAGWVKKEGICSREVPFENEAGSAIVVTNRLAVHVYEQPDTIYGPMLTLPFESRLAALEPEKDGGRWIHVVLPDSRKGYIQRGDVNLQARKMNLNEVCKFSQFFLGLPYTWGGRSSFGYDCSGFVQMLYRQIGLFLPRDSQDQFADNRFSDCPIEKLTAGDLLFWGFSKDQIRHVAFSLGEGKFIHTSAVTEDMPYIRISDVNDPTWNGSGHYPSVMGRKKKGWSELVD